MSYEGTALGCITLCAHCKYAIQLRRATYRDYDGSIQSIDLWDHFRVPITPHSAHPCPDVGQHSHRRQND